MALRCPVAPINALIPLFPEQRQRWLLVVRARDDADVTPLVRVAFQRWLPLFGPGKIGEPEIVEDPAEPVQPGALATAPDELALPTPVRRFVVVEFDYIGEPDSMRWPSFSRRRRERIDPLCPEPPLTAFPFAVLSPGGFVDEIDALPPFQAIPPLTGFNPGLPPPSEWWKEPIVIGAAAVFGGALLYRLVRR